MRKILDQSRSWQQLVGDVARARDIEDLLRRADMALAAILPESSAQLAWSADGPEGWPHPDELARLRSGEPLEGDLYTSGAFPILGSDQLLGWIQLRPGVWSGEQELALSMLAAVLGPSYRALRAERPPDSEDQELRQALAEVILELDLDRLLRGVCELVDRFCAVPTVVVVLRYRDSDWLERRALRRNGVTQPMPAFWQELQGLSGLVLRRNEPIFTDDYRSACATYGVPEMYVDGEQAVAYGWAGVPVSAGGSALGVLFSFSDDPAIRIGPPAQQRLELIGRTIGPAVDRAMRYSHSADQARQRDALNRIARTLNASRDPAEVPALIIQQAQELLGTEEGSLLLLDEQTGELVFSYAAGPAGSRLLGQRLPPGQGVAGHVASSGRAAIVNNAPVDRRFYRAADGDSGFVTRSILAVPLRGIEGVRGVIEVLNRHDGAPFTDDDRSQLEAVADQAVIALENARRFATIDQALARRAQELNRSNDRLRRILHASNALRADSNLEVLLTQIASVVADNSGFRRAAIALVIDERVPQPVVRWATSVGATGCDRRWAEPRLVTLAGLLRPEIQHGSLTYLIKRGSAEANLIWAGGPHPAPAREAGLWEEGDTLLVLLRDSRGDLIGLLLLDEPEEPGPLGETLVQIIEILGNQAATAIETARLYADQQRSLSRMTALNGLGRAISTTLRSPQQIYELTTRGIVELSGGRWAVVLLDSGEPEPDLRVSFQTGPVPSLHQSDLALLAAAVVGGRRPGSTALGNAMVTVLPLRATRSVLGAICVGYPEGPPSADDLEVMNLFASQAAVAVESLQLVSALNRGRDELASIMASTREGMLLVDDGGAVAVINDAFRMLSGAPRDLIEQPRLSLDQLLEGWGAAAGHNPADSDGLRDGLAAVASGVDTFAFGQLAPSRSGGRVLEWTVLRAASGGGLDPDDDQAPGERWPILLTLRDITAAKEAERMRQDLTNMMVHDLRSPLTSIITSIEMMFRGVSGEINKTQRDILTIALTSARHLLNMVNLLLDISRLESRRMPLDRQPSPIGELARRAVERIQMVADSRQIGVQIVSQISDRELVYADGDLVLRVLQNLLDNALKFSPPGSQVRLEIAAAAPHGDGPVELIDGGDISIRVDTGRQLRLAIHDQGVGIKAQDLEKIFTMFNQAGNRRNPGSGLGLTFCKLVVESHDGQLWVESVPGQGSSFYFTLPTATIG